MNNQKDKPVLPNLLVVGVAKCGTSSLHQYLEQHPEVYMSHTKEPRYISSQVTDLPLGGPKDDRVEAWYIKDFDQYKDLFKDVKDEKIIGESSADTFYFHEKTIPFIKKLYGDPKIIILLRHPVKRSFSAYQHLRRDDREHLSFEEGLKAEPERIAKNYELIYHYKAVSQYYEGLKAFMDNFSSVKVVLNEELSSSPSTVMKEVFEFLGVDKNVEVDASARHNMSGVPKSRWLHEFLFEGKKIIVVLRPFVRLFLNKEQRKKVSRKLFERNLTRLNINKKTQAELFEYYKPDIKKTESLLNRDLSLWK
ncbi:sulfotransferase family protein [Fulvivirga sediminis]|uniref:Sulfotransferase n=1 Tax=Fulvivirga sediminis TaxID=2803949 RepID=A0A937F9Q2_9BACT|nr:sulfotransferase [Fulvivirga sediminis]MBL3658896.1 sulfotransferase [Fulvivirga sediminis]